MFLSCNNEKKKLQRFSVTLGEWNTRICKNFWVCLDLRYYVLLTQAAIEVHVWVRTGSMSSHSWLPQFRYVGKPSCCFNLYPYRMLTSGWWVRCFVGFRHCLGSWLVGSWVYELVGLRVPELVGSWVREFVSWWVRGLVSSLFRRLLSLALLIL